MRKLGFLFSSLCALAAVFAFTAIAPASVAETPRYEKIVSNPVDFTFSQPDALVSAPAMIALAAKDMRFQTASNHAFIAMLRPADVSVLAKSKSMDVRLPLPVPRSHLNE